MEPRETESVEPEIFSGSVVSFGECVVTPRAQLENQPPTATELNQEI